MWFMDVLQMLVGVKSSGKTSIYRKLNNKKAALIKTLIAIPIAVGVVFLFTHLQTKVMSIVLGPISEGLSEIFRSSFDNVVS